MSISRNDDNPHWPGSIAPSHDRLSRCTSAYSDASHAFLLRDFARCQATVQELLTQAEAEGETAGDEGVGRDKEAFADVIRKIWILQLTLTASTSPTATISGSGDLARGQSPGSSANSSTRELQLAETFSKIQRYYRSSAVIHPSIMVALSLAGLKVSAPGFARRTLEDYFDVLLYADPEQPGSTSPEAASGDTSGYLAAADASTADLSLSGIAASTSATPARADWSKSLNRLARIYAIHLLGKTFQEWKGAKSWVEQQRSEEAGIQLVPEASAQGLLHELESAERQQEQDAQLAHEREKARTEALERQKQQQQRQPQSAGQRRKISHSANQSNEANAHTSPPSHSSASAGKARGTGHFQGRSLGDSNPLSASLSADTGFAALRSHLTSFLSDGAAAASSTRSLLPSTARPPSPTPLSVLQLVPQYLSRLASSRLLNTFFLILLLTGFWRRRLARRGHSARGEVGAAWTRLKDKVLETLKMGGKLGYV